MSNITEILDQLSLIYKRSDNIRAIIDELNKPVSQTKKKVSQIIPVLDIYQFELKGYPDDATTQTTMGSVFDSPQDECGLIEAKDKNFSIKRSSCDVIKSDAVEQAGGNDDFKDIYTIKEFHDFYQRWKAKGNLKDIYNNGIKEKSDQINMKFGKVRDRMIKYLYKKNWISDGFNFKEKYNKIKDNFQASNDQNKLAEDIKTLSDLIHEDALIYNITVKEDEKIIVFGDFHGSFHTFLRHIFRLYRAGIINDLKSLRLNEGWRIIFLGDVVDRGNYGLEILLIIAELMIRNNTEDKLKVIFNRGNHEEMVTNWNYGFKTEIKTKFGDIDIWNTINSLFSFLSSAVILKCNDKKFWLSHGGIPAKEIDEYYDVILGGDGIIFFSNTTIGYKSQNVPEQIRWNDFYLFDEPKFNRNRGTAIIINQTYARDFMKHNGIDFIIRAHQDSVGNSYLLSTINNDANDYLLDDKDNVGNIKENVVFVNKDKKITNNLESNRNAVVGPIARVKLNGLSWEEEGELLKDTTKVYPVITLSTNTDYGRMLTHDSFGVIRFDLTETEIKRFNKETNVIDPRKNMPNKLSDYLST